MNVLLSKKMLYDNRMVLDSVLIELILTFS